MYVVIDYLTGWTDESMRFVEHDEAQAWIDRQDSESFYIRFEDI